MFLYSGTCDGLVCETGDDDGGDGTTSMISTTLTAGVTYYVFVTGYSSNRGNYNLNVTCQTECDGAPNAGTVDSEMVVCSATTFALVSTGVADDVYGLVYTWQSSPPGENVWTDIDGSNSASFSLDGGITEPTDFRLMVYCPASDETSYSNVMSVTLNPVVTDCYCLPSYTYDCGSGDLISNVSLTGESVAIDNTTDCSPAGYGDYTDMPAPDLAPGETYGLSVSTTYGSPTYEQVRAWIDYNLNGVFDADEMIAASAGAGLPDGSSTFNFTVAEGLVPGNYRLRVRMVYTSSDLDFDACGNQSFGETEDYMIEILELPGCSGTPEAGTVDLSELSVCANFAFDLSVTGASDPADGLTRVWQSSPAGENVWTDIPGASSTTYTVAGGISVPTDFRYRVECVNSQETAYSDVVQVGLNPAAECYCTPEGTNSSYYVNNFSTTNGIQNITNEASGYSPGGYGDFTDLTVQQDAGGSVSFTASFGASL